MNVLIKILNSIIITINKLIDGLSKKTIETIKMSFYCLVVIIVAIGIYIGYNRGKGSAKKYGKPLNEDTNSVFDPLLKKSRNKGQYKSMLESELIEEQKDIQLKKVEFPSNENLKTEIDTKIIEPAKDIKKNTSLSIDSGKIADVERTDEKIKKPDVRELKKELPKDIIKNKAVKETSPMDNSKIIEK
jgi:hypothetical protein